ncbi:DUF6417 family protein [Streptomyces phaeofaciens]|nr:DUF6417 family protein [Streptomyces phaeofaciens]
MTYEDRAVAVLKTVADRQRAADHGWALDWYLGPLRQRVFHLAERGLTQLEDREDRAALSLWEERPVRWATRLTPPGHDLLLYARHCPRPDTDQRAPSPGARKVELIPAQMTALRLFVLLADRLQVPPAEGLAEQVRTARRDAPANRHVLYLTEEQMVSVAYGFWLHRMTGSALEANRFARDYGITHDPAAGAEGAARRYVTGAVAAVPASGGTTADSVGTGG